MGALMAALIAALIIHATDRTPALMARLRQVAARPALALIGVALSLAGLNALAAAAGGWIAPHLNPSARALFLGIALGSAALGCWMPLKPPPVVSARWLGSVVAGAASTALLGIGSAQFVAMALAMRGDPPAFAAIGATLGGVAVAAAATGPGFAAAAGGRAVRTGVGAVLLLAGAGLALGAFGLV